MLAQRFERLVVGAAFVSERDEFLVAVDKGSCLGIAWFELRKFVKDGIVGIEARDAFERVVDERVLVSFGKSLLKDEQPDIIVLNSDVSKEELLGDEVFGSLDAVTAGKIISVSNSYFESPSGRITALADELGAGEKVESDEA